MELIVIVGLVLVGLFIFKKLTKPNTSDKFTLLQLESWVSLYSNEGMWNRSSMATSLIYQSIIVANSMGASISINEFMREMNRSKETTIENVDYWLQYIASDMAKDVELEQLNLMPARIVGALIILKKTNPSCYRAFLGAR